MKGQGERQTEILEEVEDLFRRIACIWQNATHGKRTVAFERESLHAFCSAWIALTYLKVAVYGVAILRLHRIHSQRG